jgi:hypothetical protein
MRAAWRGLFAFEPVTPRWREPGRAIRSLQSGYTQFNDSTRLIGSMYLCGKLCLGAWLILSAPAVASRPKLRGSTEVSTATDRADKCLNLNQFPVFEALSCVRPPSGCD